jgi:aspartyl-tRNA(Asn)/glutamyl-tRNA(Gln) amidotransferase subunit B
VTRGSSLESRTPNDETRFFMAFETVIGLEVHAQLKTKSKIFCGCSTEFGAQPNVNICSVCTGQPGVLPVLNKKAVEYLVMTALSVNCKISPHSIFARKQYFYPDMPKNYQISQYELPLAENGYLELSGGKKINILRIHLEEDAGKLLHTIGSRELDYSLVDFNRAGMPLMEIVTMPDLSSPEEAYEYLALLKNILEYLDVSDCDMEEGKFRCDANISIRPFGQKELGTKTELKNMNSLSGVKAALEYEIKRQTAEVTAGRKIIQETRLWDAVNLETQPMRTKEQAHDYRYFPEPDLVPIELEQKFIDDIRGRQPELPKARFARFTEKLGLSEYDSRLLTSEKCLADYYEEALNKFNEKDRPGSAKPLANWVTTELLGKLNASRKTLAQSPVKAAGLAELITLIQEGRISGKMAKGVFEVMFETGKTPAAIVKEQGVAQISDEKELEKYCLEAISENPKAVAEYKAGKERAIGSLVGAVMKKTGGQANPQAVNKILKAKLTQ